MKSTLILVFINDGFISSIFRDVRIQKERSINSPSFFPIKILDCNLGCLFIIVFFIWLQNFVSSMIIYVATGDLETFYIYICMLVSILYSTIHIKRYIQSPYYMQPPLLPLLFYKCLDDVVICFVWFYLPFMRHY